jgi:hypothetical protein
MRSVFTFCAVVMAAVLATACVEGVDEVDGIDDEESEEVEVEVEVELPAAPEPEVVTPPQEIRLNDDPDEGGQIKRAADRAARHTATR